MSSLLAKLQNAITQGSLLATGAVLANCGSSADTTRIVADSGRPDAGMLAPYPQESLGCHGTDYGNGPGYHGQCCAKLECYAPQAGQPCVAVHHVAEAGVPLPPGSGKCSCGGSNPLKQGVDGPFAAPADAGIASDGCCYLVSSITCDGRPLIVDDHALLADVVADGSGWA